MRYGLGTQRHVCQLPALQVPEQQRPPRNLLGTQRRTGRALASDRYGRSEQHAYRNPRSGFRLFRAGPTPWVILIFGVRGNSNTPNPQRVKNRQLGTLDSPANLFHERQSPAKTESANRFFAPQIVASPLVKRSPRILTAHMAHGMDKTTTTGTTPWRTAYSPTVIEGPLRSV